MSALTEMRGGGGIHQMWGVDSIDANWTIYIKCNPAHGLFLAQGWQQLVGELDLAVRHADGAAASENTERCSLYSEDDIIYYIYYIELFCAFNTIVKAQRNVSSPPEPVVGRSSSRPWPSQCIRDTAPPPAPSLPPCRGRGRAESGPAGPLWPCWWRSGRASQTSADPPALEK